MDVAERPLGHRQLAVLLNVYRRGTVFPAGTSEHFRALAARGLVEGRAAHASLTPKGSNLAQVVESFVRLPLDRRRKAEHHCRLVLGLANDDPELETLAELGDEHAQRLLSAMETRG